MLLSFPCYEHFSHPGLLSAAPHKSHVPLRHTRHLTRNRTTQLKSSRSDYCVSLDIECRNAVATPQEGASPSQRPDEGWDLDIPRLTLPTQDTGRVAKTEREGIPIWLWRRVFDSQSGKLEDLLSRSIGEKTATRVLQLKPLGNLPDQTSSYQLGVCGDVQDRKSVV